LGCRTGRNMNIVESVACHVCGSGNLEVVFDTPNLPLTGIYLDSKVESVLPTFDQSFMYCMECGHGQVRNLIDPAVLYDDTYTHRTSTSAIATSGNDFFYQQLLQVTGGRKFKSLLEIGCNDLYLMKKVQDLADHLVGIDPIWVGKDQDLNDKTRILGRFIEEIQVGEDITEKPDIILSAHTFEHIQDLYGQLLTLVELAADGCLFVIEVPSLDRMVDQRRFDQVFHQHINYTSLSSMRRLVSRLGCTFLGNTFNYGYWGGTFMFWFEKSGKDDEVGMVGFEASNIDEIKSDFREFQKVLGASISQAEKLPEKCYGFGAAQMLPVLAYHMESDLGFMDAILDDNPDRHLTYLPGVKPLIRKPEPGEMGSAAVMITALDSSRSILSRLIKDKPRRILYPIQCF